MIGSTRGVLRCWSLRRRLAIPWVLTVWIVGVWLPACSVGGDDWNIGDQVVTVEEDVELGERENLELKLARGSRITITEIRGAWIGGYHETEGKSVYGWVHRLQVKRPIQPISDLVKALDKESAVKVFRELGAEVEVDHEGEVISLDASQTRLPNEALAYLKFFTRLSTLQLSGTSISDEGLVHLGKARSLEMLYLDRTDITDEGVKQLAELPRLGLLVLEGTAVTGGSLEVLRKLPELSTLNLSRCRLTDEQLAVCQEIKTLEVLNLSHTSIQGEGLNALQSLPRLRVLNLDRTPVTDEGLLKLSGQPTLKMLHLRQTKISDATVDKLKSTLRSCAIYRR